MDFFQNKYISFSYLNIFFFNSITYFGLHYPQIFIYLMPFLYLYTNIVLFFYVYFSYDHFYMNKWYSLYLLDQETSDSDAPEDSFSEKDESYSSDNNSDYENNNKEKDE